MEFIKEPFKKLIEYKSGYTWTKNQELKKYEDGCIRVLTVTNIQKELDLDPELYLQYVSEKDRKEKAVAKDWSIAVSSNGNRKRIGNAIYIEKDEAYLFASFLTAFKPKDDNIINPKYFYYWLTSFQIQERISSVSEGTTGLGNLDIRFLRNLDIQYPKQLEEQQAIAGILTKVDEAINATNQSIKATQKLKKALMQNLLTGKMKPDGCFRTEDEFYEDEKFGKVPKGWEIKRFKDCSVLQRGKDLTDKNVVDGIYPVVKSNGVKIFHNSFFIKPPGIVTGRSGTIGKVFYIKEPFWAHNTTLYVKDFKGNNRKFIFYLIKKMDFRKYYAGTTVPTLNRNDIHRLKIKLPKTVKEQKAIAEKIQSIDDLIFNKTNKLKSLEKLKKSLMQHLLTGKKRVDVVKVNQLLNE